jgi:adenylate cyclase
MTAPPTLTLRHPVGEHFEWTSVAPAGATIGRKDSCDIVLASVDVSRQHAEVRFERGRWVVRDLGSSNGTFVGAVRVTEHELRSGDRVRIGGFELECRLGAASELTLADAKAATPAARLDMRNFDALVSQVLEARPAGDDAGGLGATPRPVPASRPASVQDARRVLQLLHGAANALMEHDELDATLNRVVELVFEHLPAERCFVLLKEEGSEQLTPRIERAAPGARQGELRLSRNIVETALRSQQSVLVRDTAADNRFAQAESIVSLGICSAMCAPLSHMGRVGGLIYVDLSTDSEAFSTDDLGVLSILAAISASAVERAQMRENLERERRVRERLARYHAPGVIERIAASTELDDGAMEAEEREVSVLFADLSGFTRLAERLGPREVTATLNQIFGVLTEEVFREGGTLDKFIGDAVMAFFGAPLAQPDHALRAVRSARAMLARLATFHAQCAPELRLGLRIGINSGLVIVGDVGAQQRRDYTVIGDTVNVASRLESSVARAGQIVIGPATHAAVQRHFACEALAPVVLKGRSVELRPYLVGEPLRGV